MNIKIRHILSRLIVSFNFINYNASLKKNIGGVGLYEEEKGEKRICLIDGMGRSE